MDNHSSAILNGSKIAQELESPIARPIKIVHIVGIKFPSLIRTPIYWPAILQILLMCSEKFSLDSIVTPNNLRESVILI